MSTNSHFRINTPNITHETIDGETVIINLDSGNYYSIEGVGTDIWSFIERGATVGDIVEMVEHRYEGVRADIEHAVNGLIAELQGEGLIVPDKLNGSEGSGGVDIKAVTEQVNGKGVFKVPILNKYTDMQDLLLLDPIHEVDDSGWPTPKSSEQE